MLDCPPTASPPVASSRAAGLPTRAAPLPAQVVANTLAIIPAPNLARTVIGSLFAGIFWSSLLAPVALQAASASTRAAQKAPASVKSPNPIQSPTPAENLGVLTNRELAAVQQPLFGTNGKLELGVQTGILPADVYVFSASAGLQGTLHLNDRLGVELNTQYSWGFETYASRTLRTQGIRVDAWSPLALVTVDAVYAPIYAKLNLLGKRILHFDVALVGGGGLLVSERTLYNDVSASADASRYGMPLSLNAGLLHRYYVHLFGQQFALRLDARDHLSLLQGLEGNFWLKHNLLLGLGVSTFLPARKAGGT